MSALAQAGMRRRGKYITASLYKLIYNIWLQLEKMLDIEPRLKAIETRIYEGDIPWEEERSWLGSLWELLTTTKKKRSRTYF